MKRILHVSSDLKGLYCCKILLCFLRIWDDTQWNGEEFLWRRGGREWGRGADQQTGNRAPRTTLQVVMSLFITFVNCFWMPWGGRGGSSDFKLNMSATLQAHIVCFFYYRVFFIPVPPKKIIWKTRRCASCNYWKKALTHSLTYNFKSRDASASKNVRSLADFLGDC